MHSNGAFSTDQLNRDRGATGARRWSFLHNRDVWALGLMLVITLVFFRRFVFGGDIFWGADITFFFYPTRALLADAFRSHDIRSILWTPHLFGGYPLFAEGQIGALYPLNWLFGLPFWSPLVMYSIQTVLHYFMAAAFMYAYARAIRIKPAGALVAAVCFAFNGFMVSHIYHTSLMNAAVWLPLLFLFAERFLTRGRWSFLVLDGLVLAAMILAGHPQIALMSILALGGYTAFRVVFGPDVQWQRGRSIVAVLTRGRIKHWNGIWAFASKLVWAALVFLLVVGIGILLAAAQIVPLLELTNCSVRAGAAVNYEMATSYSLPVEHVWTLLFPFRFGDFQSYRGPWNFAELALYVGVMPLVLALVSLLQKPDRYTLFFLLLGLVCLGLALGGATPLFKVLHLLPVYRGMRAPARFVLFFDFAVAVIAGFGLTNLYSVSGWGEKRKYLFVAALLLVLIGVWTINRVEHERAIASARAAPGSTGDVDCSATNCPYRAFLPLVVHTKVPWVSRFIGNFSHWVRRERTRFYLFLLMAVAVLLPKPRGRWTAWLRLLCIVLIVVDLFAFFERLSDDFFAEPGQVRGYFQRENRVASFVNAQGEEQRVYNVRRHPSNGLLPLEVSSLDGYTPLLLKRYPEYESSALEGDVDLFSLTSVRYVIDHADHFSAIAERNNFSLVYKAGMIAVYENATALPRAFVVFDAVVEGDSALARLRQQGLDPAQTVVLEEAFDVAQLPGSFGEATIDLVDETATHLTFNTYLSQNGFLVLNDTYYPGWTVSVDGERSKVYRANYWFRAVFLPSGRHTVVFSYRPFSLYLGVGISALTLIGVGACLVRSLRSARPSPSGGLE